MPAMYCRGSSQAQCASQLCPSKNALLTRDTLIRLQKNPSTSSAHILFSLHCECLVGTRCRALPSASCFLYSTRTRTTGALCVLRVLCRGASQAVHLLPPRAVWDVLVRRAASSACGPECDCEPSPEPASSAAAVAGNGSSGSASEAAGGEVDAELDELLASAAASTCAIPLPFGWERALDARNREYFIECVPHLSSFHPPFLFHSLRHLHTLLRVMHWCLMPDDI